MYGLMLALNVVPDVPAVAVNPTPRMMLFGAWNVTLAGPLTVKLVSAVIELLAQYVVVPDVMDMFVRTKLTGSVGVRVSATEADVVPSATLVAVTVTVC
jgi:hypothetical protein